MCGATSPRGANAWFALRGAMGICMQPEHAVWGQGQGFVAVVEGAGEQVGGELAGNEALGIDHLVVGGEVDDDVDRLLVVFAGEQDEAIVHVVEPACGTIGGEDGIGFAQGDHLL